MTDKEHSQTDEILAEMEKHLAKIYAQANEEIQEKAKDYFEKFREEYEKRYKLVESEEMTEEEFKEWNKKKILHGKYWNDMTQQLAQEYHNINKTAVAYINDRLPEIYALNYNAIKSTAESLVKGYSFSLVNAETVKRLATKDKTLLPYKVINGRKDVRWNTQKVNSAMMQGVLQGESVPKIAKRLETVTAKDRASALRNARSCVTAAENYGRMDSYHRMQDEGRTVTKLWMATLDFRTRHEHGRLDGVEMPLDKPFEVDGYKIMMPGDVNAEPEMYYNCRCRLFRKIGKGRPTERVARVNVDGREKSKVISYMNYEEWYEWRKQNGNNLYR